MKYYSAFFAAALLVLTLPARAEPGFVDVADLTIAAPVIVQAIVTRIERVSDRDSPGLAPGRARLLITAAVDAAIIAPGPVPPKLVWLWDAALDSRGNYDKSKNQQIIAWLAVPDQNGETRLVSANAQLPWTSALAAQVREIATQARSGRVPKITGVTNGFRAVGTVPGESESQFFLSTPGGRSATMVVTTQPGMARQVTVSSGNVIDQSAAPIQTGTLLWYRLACSLPAKLPISAGGNDPALAADWQGAMTSLGPCVRGN
jgi:hypothetical protein